MSAIRNTDICDLCSLWLPRFDIRYIERRPGVVIRFCARCDQQRQADLTAFLEHPALRKECAHCHHTFQQGEGYFIVWCDRTHQALCPSCEDTYVAKRRDIYHQQTTRGRLSRCS